MNTARIEGRIKFFNNEKGFGFVRNPLGGEEKDFFLHASEVPPGVVLQPGDLVAFQTKQTRRGTAATAVELLKRAETKPRREHADAQP